MHNPTVPKNRLDRIILRGFKTIRELDFRPGPLTVLIGPNGAGKSNLISFFRLLSWALSDRDNLQVYIGRHGGAASLLHDGSTTTHEIETELTIRTDSGENQYSFRLVYAAADTFIFADERLRYSADRQQGPAPWQALGAGHRSPQLLARSGDTARIIRHVLRRVVVHQFHDTSFTSRMRARWRVHDNRRLKEDAANIAPVLYRLRENESFSYQRIVDTVRLILPFFADFELEPSAETILLGWRERNSDLVFDASQASDGMLRIIALITLLLQPVQDLPDVLILDEPELGLHPYAINVIGGLTRAISTRIQAIVATQSAALVDCFEPQDTVVVERRGRASEFNRLDADELAVWLQSYSLSELWEKNVIGGRP